MSGYDTCHTECPFLSSCFSLQIRGTGPTRTVKLKSQPHYTSLFALLSMPPSARPVAVTPPPPSTSSTLPPPHLLTDEVTAVLMSTHGLKMSLVELTKGYNQAFRGPLAKAPKVESGELLQALQSLPNFKVRKRTVCRHFL